MTQQQVDQSVTDWLARQGELAVTAMQGKKREVREEADRVCAEIDREIDRVKAAMRALRREAKPRARRHSTTRRQRDARELAGPANLKAAEQVLKRKRHATGAQIRKATGKNSGTITYAMRALVEDGKARETGRVIDRSPEFEWVPESERVVVRPGD